MCRTNTSAGLVDHSRCLALAAYTLRTATHGFVLESSSLRFVILSFVFAIVCCPLATQGGPTHVHAIGLACDCARIVIDTSATHSVSLQRVFLGLASVTVWSRITIASSAFVGAGPAGQIVRLAIQSATFARVSAGFLLVPAGSSRVSDGLRDVTASP